MWIPLNLPFHYKLKHKGKVPHPNPNPNPNFNALNFEINTNKTLTRKLNRCDSLKPLTDFDVGKYTCRNCTSAKINCQYCASIVRYDGIKAHVKKQHPDVDLPRWFSVNLNERCVNTQTGESCSYKYFNFVSFLINYGINIDKVKENIN